MSITPGPFRWAIVGGQTLAAMMAGFSMEAPGQEPTSTPIQTVILEAEGTVQTTPAGRVEWQVARTNQVLAPREQIRTRELSRATLRLRDRSLYRLGELTQVSVEASDDSSSSAVNMLRGVLMFLHRGRPKDVQFRTGTVSAAIRGTEFHVEVADNGRTVLTLFDGEVELSNPQGVLRLVGGEQASVDPGQAPVKTAVLVPRHDLIQWCLYYPGVLDLAELNFAPAEVAVLGSSVEAYRAGDLLQALARVPAGFQPASDSTQLYLAAVLLSVGKVDLALPLLEARPAAGVTDHRTAPQLAGALARLIRVVKNSPAPTELELAVSSSSSATVRLVESYQYQAKGDLVAALAAAKEATSLSRDFAFAWVRVAELEFSFGHLRKAEDALARGLELAPRNAEAVTLRGFLLISAGRVAAAEEEFNHAIALDGALGNAWLGRGLGQIRRGELERGREDLQVAVLLEPQRALFRSYLGKAWTELGEPRRAEDELRLGMADDSGDPTAWFYMALLLQQENRINEAIVALEHSQDLNDNRQVYRSRLLLDQDAAVRGVNLATIYRDAGLTDWSVREAGRGLGLDYANGAAHQFLSDSYTALRDPQQVNLRYETPAVTEHLLASLLSPVGAVALSRVVSQQEYSRLFERNHFGLAADSSYFSSGAWEVSAAQHGLIDGTAYAVEGFYRHDPGTQPNGQFEERTVVGRFSQKITQQDSLYVEASDSLRKAGDVTPYYHPSSANLSLSTKDAISPTAAVGWHREWNAQSHTLLLGTYLHSDYQVHDPVGNIGSVAIQTSNGVVVRALPIFFTQKYDGQFDIFSGEIQQILQSPRHTSIGGLLYQGGEFRTRNVQDNPDIFDFLFPELPVSQDVSSGFGRLKGYLYHDWEILDGFTLAGGLTYDWMRFPANHRSAPVADDEEEKQGWSPKFGAIWTPRPGTTLRAAQSWAMTGVSFDQSYQLEPTQIAGFNQAYRSLIPESLAGANAGADLSITSAGVEQRFGHGTYATLSAERLASQVGRTIGTFTVTDNPTDQFAVGSTPQHLDFVENSIALNVHQLLGQAWVVGGGWRSSRAELDQRFASFSSAAVVDPPLQAASQTEAVLHQANLRVICNLASGFFGEAQALWWLQTNYKDTSSLPNEELWQFNVFAGWRGFRRRVEISAGLLNLTDRDYHFNPVNYLAQPPRERTLFARLKFNY